MSTTASLQLLTGLPGAGKSLRLVDRIIQDQAAGRLVYVCNVNGLQVEGVMPWEDPMKWQDLPTGSTLYVDEAQEYFPARRSGDPRDEVRALSKVRHSGIQIVLVTQRPTYLDAYVRGLVGMHEHLLRKDGAEKSYIFRMNEVMEDPQSLRARVKADTETYRFRPELYKFYKSAEIHTIKYKMPARTKRGIMIACGAVALLLMGASGFIRDQWNMRHPDKPGTTQPAGVALAERASILPATPRAQEREPLTLEEYTQRQVPRIATQPWSAPIFDGRQAVAEPKIICASTEDSCTCMTEQATRYRTTIDDCRYMARWGSAYNPFKMPDQVRPEPVKMFDAEQLLEQAGSSSSSSHLGESWNRPRRIPGAVSW